MGTAKNNLAPNPERMAARRTRAGRASHLRDVIYGGIDGAVTTFAIVAGVEGADLSPSVIIALGIANVLADGFSMAAGNFAGTKADLDDQRRLRAVEDRHIDVDPDGEREKLREILRLKGLEGELLDQAADAISAKRSAWVEMMLVEEHGLSPVNPNPKGAAIATFLAFLITGTVPLLPFVVGFDDAFQISAASTAVVFFAIGAMKSRWSLDPWWKSGLETLLIGGVAAGIAFFVGTLFRG